MSAVDTGDRVRDRISDETGTVKGHFMNQAIVHWDQPDESGNLVSSVPAADLNPLDEESDAGSPAKKNTDAATETPSKEESPMPNTIKIPATVNELCKLADQMGVKPSEYLDLLGPIPTAATE